MVARASSAVFPLLIHLDNFLHRCSLPASPDDTPRLPRPGIETSVSDSADVVTTSTLSYSTPFEPIASWFHTIWAYTYLFTLTDLGYKSSLTWPTLWWAASASLEYANWTHQLRNLTSTEPQLLAADSGIQDGSHLQWTASVPKISVNTSASRTLYGLTSVTYSVSPNSDTRYQGTGGRRYTLPTRIPHYPRGSTLRKIHLQTV